MAMLLCRLVRTYLAIGMLQVVLGLRLQTSVKMSMEELANWTRAELVQKLGFFMARPTSESEARDPSIDCLLNPCHENMRATPYTPEKDGLIWSGTARFPGFVFTHGFQKPYAGTKHDMGENLTAWAASIESSVVDNTRAWGFHFTTNPKVAAQFGVAHVYHAAGRVPNDEADLNILQHKYGCPADDSQIWTQEGPDLGTWKTDFIQSGLENLCPNWGYAYVVRAEGIHISTDSYNAEEEVFVPIGVKPEEVLGAIPIYARTSYDNYRVFRPHGLGPDMTSKDINESWDGPFGWKGGLRTVPAVHTKDGKDSATAIGAFIFNPNYKGDAHAEVAKELAKRQIVNDLGTAIPTEAP